jgi:DNA-binding MarR family transcriptional regulator
MMTRDEPHWKMFALVSGIYMKSRRLAERWLKPLNMTFPQFGALLNLSQGDRITQRELAEKLEADTTTAMVLCDSLEKKGWINRVRDPSDRRVNRLVLTEVGRDVFGKAYPLMLSGYELFAQGVSQERLESTLPVLEELYVHISEHYRREARS